MKSDHWLLGKIVEESLTKRDIAHLRKLLANGHTDEEALKALRERMHSNSKGMRMYIRHEKLRALTLKLSYRIHWTYIHMVIKKWLREKELLIRWKEHQHGTKVDNKALDIKKELLSNGHKLKHSSFDEDAEHDLLLRIENAAEELLQQIEKEEAHDFK